VFEESGAVTGSNLIANVLRGVTSFGRDAVANPIAVLFGLSLVSLGIYVAAVIVWMFFLLIASLFGFKPESEIREHEESVVFMSAHR